MSHHLKVWPFGYLSIKASLSNPERSLRCPAACLDVTIFTRYKKVQMNILRVTGEFSLYHEWIIYEYNNEFNNECTNYLINVSLVWFPGHVLSKMDILLGTGEFSLHHELIIYKYIKEWTNYLINVSLVWFPGYVLSKWKLKLRGMTLVGCSITNIILFKNSRPDTNEDLIIYRYMIWQILLTIRTVWIMRIC